jgi:hypothetical protein
MAPLLLYPITVLKHGGRSSLFFLLRRVVCLERRESGRFEIAEIKSGSLIYTP